MRHSVLHTCDSAYICKLSMLQKASCTPQIRVNALLSAEPRRNPPNPPGTRNELPMQASCPACELSPSCVRVAQIICAAVCVVVHGEYTRSDVVISETKDEESQLTCTQTIRPQQCQQNTAWHWTLLQSAAVYCTAWSISGCRCW
jgi:rubredoxin